MSRCSVCHQPDCYESFHDPAAVAERAEQRMADLEERVAEILELVRALAAKAKLQPPPPERTETR